MPVKSCLIDDGLAEHGRKTIRQLGNASAVTADTAWAGVHGAAGNGRDRLAVRGGGFGRDGCTAISMRSFDQAGAFILREDQRVDGQLPGLAVNFQFESLIEQRLEHHPELIQLRGAGRFRLQIEPLRLEPIYIAEDLKIGCAVGDRDQALQVNICRRKFSAGQDSDCIFFEARRIRFQRCCFKLRTRRGLTGSDDGRCDQQ